MQDGRQAKFLFLPEGEDPDTLVRAKGKAYLENLFDHSDPLETFLFKHLEQGLDIESMDGRARFPSSRHRTCIDFPRECSRP